MVLEIENKQILEQYKQDFITYAESFKKDEKYVLNVDAEIISVKLIQ